MVTSIRSEIDLTELPCRLPSNGQVESCGDISVIETASINGQTYSIDCRGISGRFVEISQRNKWKNKICLELREVEVYGYPPEQDQEEKEEEEEEDNGGCPSGTVRCEKSGVCKHVHMCKKE